MNKMNNKKKIYKINFKSKLFRKIHIFNPLYDGAKIFCVCTRDFVPDVISFQLTCLNFIGKTKMFYSRPRNVSMIPFSSEIVGSLNLIISLINLLPDNHRSLSFL